MSVRFLACACLVLLCSAASTQELSSTRSLQQAATGVAPTAVAAAAQPAAATTTAAAQPAAAAVQPAAGGAAAAALPAPAATTAAAGPAATATGPAAAQPGAEPAAAAALPAPAAEPAAAAAVQPAAAAAEQPATAAAVPAEPAATAATAEPAGAAAMPAEPAAAAAVPADPMAAAEPEEPAAPAPASSPQVLRPGVYVIADPPPPPRVVPRPVVATPRAPAGPALPAPGKNLMVVMTVMGQEAADIYKNQASIRQQVATAAGVGSEQVFFYNQTANMDPRTGVTAMSLIMNIDCADQLQCAQAGRQLYNTSSQTKLTDGLARNSISLLPGTFQVYGVNQVGGFRGNATLYENRALTAPKAPAAALDPSDYNTTMARFTADLQADAAKAAARSANGTAEADEPAAKLPNRFGNFSIPGLSDGDSGSLDPFANLTAGLDALLPGLNATRLPPGEELNNTVVPAEAVQPRSAAGGAAAGGALPLAAAAAAAVLLLCM